MHRFQELKIWQKAMELTVNIYKCAEDLPQTEKFGLVSQIKRCAVSICSNIAEGAGRNTSGEFKQFLGIASGSAFELHTQLELLDRLNYLDNAIKNELIQNLEEIQKMLFNLMKSLK